MADSTQTLAESGLKSIGYYTARDNQARALCFVRNCNLYCRLKDIQPDGCAIMYVVFFPFLRLGAGQSAATLERRMPRER